jgi:hypothetical protein
LDELKKAAKTRQNYRNTENVEIIRMGLEDVLGSSFLVRVAPIGSLVACKRSDARPIEENGWKTRRAAHTQKHNGCGAVEGFGMRLGET